MAAPLVDLVAGTVAWPNSSSAGLKQLNNLEPADIHVLLVDDERLSRIVVGNLLRKCGYRGTLAGSQWRPPCLAIARGESKAAVRATTELWPYCSAVTPAGSGQEALEILRKSQPGTFQLVLTVRHYRISLSIRLPWRSRTVARHGGARWWQSAAYTLFTDLATASDHCLAFAP